MKFIGTLIVKPNLNKIKIGFYLPSKCPNCKERTFDADEGTCSNCGYGQEPTITWGG